MSIPHSKISAELLDESQKLTAQFVTKFYPGQESNAELKAKALQAILFYKHQGYARDNDTLLSEINGIDFTKDVRIEEFDAGAKFNQMQRPGKIGAEVFKGNYYTREDSAVAADPNFIEKLLTIIKKLVGLQLQDGSNNPLNDLRRAADSIGISDVVLIDPITGGPVNFDAFVSSDPTDTGSIGSTSDSEQDISDPNADIPVLQAVLAEKQKTGFKATDKVIGLVSHAKPVDDTWSAAGISVPTAGGGEQIWIGPNANDKIATDRGIRVERIMERIASDENPLSRIFSKSQDLKTNDRVALVEEIAIAYGKLEKFHKFKNDDACRLVVADLSKFKADFEKKYPADKRAQDEKNAPTGLSLNDILSNIDQIITAGAALAPEEKKSPRPGK